MFTFFSRIIAHHEFYKRITLCVVIGFPLYLFIDSVWNILEPFIIGFIGAYLLNKIAVRVDKYIPRGVSASFLMLSLILGLVLISSYVIPLFKREFVELSKEIPLLYDRLMSRTDGLLPFTADKGLTAPLLQTNLSQHYGKIIEWAVNSFGNLLSNGLLLANTVSLLLISPIIMFYLLRDWLSFSNYCLSFFKKSQHRQFYLRCLSKIDSTISSYLLAQSGVCVVLSVLYCAALSLLGLDRAILIGLVSGILSFIPYLGFVVGLISSLSIAFVGFVSWGQIGSIFIVYLAIMIIEGKVIVPKLLGSKLGLHPVWILFAILTGATWFGFQGIILAIPVAAISLVIFKEFRFYFVEQQKY